jgi:hypothetical protein
MQVAAVELSVLVPIVLALKEIAHVMHQVVKQHAARKKKPAAINN